VLFFFNWHTVYKYFSLLETRRELRYKSELNTVPLVRIIGLISFLWSTIYYTSGVRGQAECNLSVLGRMCIYSYDLRSLRRRFPHVHVNSVCSMDTFTCVAHMWMCLSRTWMLKHVNVFDTQMNESTTQTRMPMTYINVATCECFYHTYECWNIWMCLSHTPMKVSTTQTNVSITYINVETCECIDYAYECWNMWMCLSHTWMCLPRKWMLKYVNVFVTHVYVDTYECVYHTNEFWNM